ncbi:MAG: outer membrane beta-barrel protein [Flavobacteriaceae bacterium]
MGENKLDKLFQEKIQDLQEVPDDKVWSAISDSLDKRKKSKIIPLWWKLGGVAAVLAFAVVAITQFSDNSGEDAIITDVEQSEPAQKVGPKGQQTPILKEKEPQNDAFVGVEKSEVEENGQNRPAVKETPDRIAVTDSPKEREANPEATPQNIGKSSISGDKEAEIASVQKNDGPDKKTATASDLAKNNRANSGDGDINRGVEPKKESIAEARVGPDALEKSQNDENRLAAQNGLAENSPKQNGGKPEVFAKDSVGKKSLYDEIAAQEQLEIEEIPRKKWSAGPNVAPVYFNAFGEGSPVHSIFVPNAKSGETNLSYGLSVAYEISDRLSLRSGINKVDYGYGTADVEFTSSAESSANGQIDNIDYALTSRNLVVQSKVGTRVVSVNDAPETKALDVSAKSAARDGNMSQQFGYLEVPLELNYALVDRKVGLHVIGGFSSLFLVENAVTLTSGNQTMEMGEANNINSVNFSTNVGFGIDYKFSPGIILNLEPIFKYQLNTFSNVDGTFQPFSVGVYSGLSFRF